VTSTSSWIHSTPEILSATSGIDMLSYCILLFEQGFIETLALDKAGSWWLLLNPGERLPSCQFT